MSTMIIEVYDAFKSAGASEEKATAAAKAIAIMRERVGMMPTLHFGTIYGELSALKMMIGIVIALNMAIIGLIVNTLIAK